MPTDRNADIKLSITPDQASAANLQHFVDNLNAGLQKVDNSTQDITRSAQQAGDALKQNIDQTSSKLDAELKLWDDLIAKLKTTKSEAGGLDFSGVSGLRRTGGALNQLGLNAIGDPVRIAGDIGQVGKQLEAMGSAAIASEAGIGGLVASMGPMLAVAVPLGLAILDIKLAMDLMKKGVDDATQAAKDAYAQDEKDIEQKQKNRAAVASQNPDQANKDVVEKNNKVLDQQQEMAKLQAKLADDQKKLLEEDTKNPLFLGIGTFKHDQLKATLDEDQKSLNDAMQKQNTAFGDLKNEVEDVQPWVKLYAMLDKGKQSVASAADNVKKFFDETEKLTKQSTDKRLAEIKKEQDKEVAAADKQRDETVKALQKRDDEIEKIEDNSAQKRLDIAQRYGETLVAIAQKSVDSANAALINLEQKREDLATSSARSGEQADRANAIKELDIRIKDQRQERDDLANHLKTLQDIRQSAREKEADFTLNRNFLGLFQNQEQTNRDLNKENKNYDTQQQKRNQAEADQLSELQRQIAVERNERQIAYHNQLQDAQKAYNRELEAADRARVIELRNAAEAKSRELRNAAEAESRQLKIAYDGSVKQIQLINMTEAQKLKIYETYLAQYARMNIPGTGGDATYNGARNPGTYHINRFAGGGAMNAGQWGMVNEPGSSGFESFSAGGKTIAFPGMGLFKPLKGGNVNGGGPSVNVTIHAPGIDARAAAAIARREVLSGLKQIEGH